MCIQILYLLGHRPLNRFTDVMIGLGCISFCRFWASPRMVRRAHQPGSLCVESEKDTLNGPKFLPFKRYPYLIEN